MPKTKEEIFRAGSTTYFFSSIFFPPDVREDVFTLYAYVRTADDFVDAIPQDEKGFSFFKKETFETWEGKKSDNIIISEFIKLAKEKQFEKVWIEAFLSAMEMDLTVKKYKTFTDLENYVYGSAEVIGLFMAKILDLPPESYEAARLQGKAMQLINFIRDIQEDIDLGRVYLPQEDLKKFKIGNLDKNVDKEKFNKLTQFEIQRYRIIQEGASNGFKYIPRRYRIPIQTAAGMYNWTADQIYRNPMVVFEKKLKPKPLRVIGAVIKNFITT